MALSFRQLQIFCAVARCGSTTAAAESISLSQSATSAALNELESQLSTRLFDRVGKRLQLNEVGRRFLPQALRLLDGVAQLEQQFAVSAAPQASLTVAASSTIGNYVLPRLLASFEREQPGVRVNARFSSDSPRLDAQRAAYARMCQASRASRNAWATPISSRRAPPSGST